MLDRFDGMMRRLEAYLTIRGEEYLASLQSGQPGAAHVGNAEGVSPAEVSQHFVPGSGMDEVIPKGKKR